MRWLLAIPIIGVLLYLLWQMAQSASDSGSVVIDGLPGGEPMTFGGFMGFSASQIAAAIKQVETGGRYQAEGASGENGAYQFMPATWASWAQKWLGDSAAPMTPENQDAVATAQIQHWLDQGYTPQQIALLWNGGTTTPKSGVNSHGVAYDSGAYAQKVLAALGTKGA